MKSKETITVTMPCSDQLCRDIMCTAIEGGSNYWAQFKVLESVPGEFGNDYQKVRVYEIDENTGNAVSKHIIDPSHIRAGIALILTGKLDIHVSIVADIFKAVAENDAGQIDGDCADTIMQSATLKSIVYG